MEQTTFVRSTQITATIPASQLAPGAVLPVIAESGSATSGSGTPVNLTVNNPAPVITAFAPSSFVAGASSPLIAVTEVPTTIIEVNGAARATAFVSSTQVNVTLTSDDLAGSCAVGFIAVNTVPGGGTSAAAPIAVNNPAPTITVLNPATVAFVVSGTGTTTANRLARWGTNGLAFRTGAGLFSVRWNVVKIFLRLMPISA